MKYPIGLNLLKDENPLVRVGNPCILLRGIVLQCNLAVDLIDYRRKRLELEPLLLNDLVPLNGDLKSLEFRRVECHGIFNERESVYVGPRSRSISGVTENGYYVVTPLMLTTGNPGSWRDKDLGEPQDAKKPSNVTPEDVQDKEGSSWWKFWSKKAKVIKLSSMREADPKGFGLHNLQMGLEHGNQTDQDQDQEPTVIPVKVVGVVRGSEKPSIFVPANDPSSGQWFYVDVPAIAQAVRLPENTIYIEDINDNVNPSQPYPVPKDVDSLVRYSVMPQDHLNYTFTWYAFYHLKCSNSLFMI
ncbi:hypothetical protein ACLOJK_003536 [Asimina triloba]